MHRPISSLSRTLASGVFGLLALVLWAAPAMAQVVVTLTPANGSAARGSTNNVLLVTAVNNSLATTLSGFNVTLFVDPASGITFTGGDSSVSNYVFNGNSSVLLFNNPSGTNTGDINDNAANLDGAFLIGQSYNLGRFFYSVSAGAPLGSQNVTLMAATSFTDGFTAGLNPIPYANVDSVIGTINITAIPEPTPLVLGSMGLGLGAVALSRGRSPRRARQS